MQWRLGLDMGTNSIGWCAVELLAGRPDKLIDLGVRIFSDGREPKSGDPLAVQRRDARSARRRRDRTLKRKRQLLNCLVDNGLLPKDIEERKKLALLDPYEIRKKALDGEISPYELGRALFHIGVRRGFKSNRKELHSDDKELSTNNQKIQDTHQQLIDTDSRTLGEFLYKRKIEGKSLRFRPSDESLYPSRDMYEAEFEEIQKVQISYHKGINWNDIANVIFYQRPLRPQERGKCQFYHDKYRAFKITPSAQEFRILSEINNLKYFNEDGLLVSLTDEQKDILENELNHARTKTFTAIRRKFKLPDHCIFNLEQPGKDKLKGNSISFEMRKEGFFGKTWDELPLSIQDTIVENLVILQSDEEVSEMLSLYDIYDEQNSEIIKMSLPHDTVRLSNEFMRDCIEIMRGKHIRYDEACLELGVHHSHIQQGEILSELPYYGKVLSNSTLGAKPEVGEEYPEIKYGKIGNPTVHIALNQLRKLVNCLIERFGHPSEIIIELSRDLKTGQKEKSRIQSEQVKNQKRNDKISNELKSVYRIAEPNSWDRKKYLLWEELGDNPLERRCIYCGKQISAAQLFSSQIEIEHILPFSRTLSSAMSNLTVAHRSCNALKKNQTPYEAFGANPRGFNWKGIVERANALPLSCQRKKEYLQTRDMEELQVNTGFLERQLNDNRYLSKATRDYLSAICDKHAIWSTPGKQTSILRAKWGLNTILNNNHDTWFKNRYDHRHHAIDALVISLTDRNLINQMAKLNQQSSPYSIEVPDLPFHRRNIVDKVKNILPSIKRDHGHQGKMYKETATTQKYRLEQLLISEITEKDIDLIESPVVRSLFVQMDAPFTTKKKQIATLLKQGDDEPRLSVKRVYWVARKPLNNVTFKDIEKGRIFDKNLEILISSYVKGLKKDIDLKKSLQELSEQTGIRHIRYIPDNQKYIQISSAPHKWYENEDFYAVIVWRVPVKKGFKYVGSFISRAEGYAFSEDRLDIGTLRPHPAAKKIMTVFKNDILAITPEDSNEKIFAKVCGFSTTQNKLDIRSIHASEDLFSWIDSTNFDLAVSYWGKQKGHNFKSINTLFSECNIETVRVSPDGRIK